MSAQVERVGNLFCLDPSPLLQEEQGGHIPPMHLLASNISSGTNDNLDAFKHVLKYISERKKPSNFGLVDCLNFLN